MSESLSTSFVEDPVAQSVLRRLYAAELAVRRGEYDDSDLRPFSYVETGFSIYPKQGDFLHSLVRFAKPDVVVEFATSLGFSSIYLASALKANGSGRLYGSEIVPEKAAQAVENLAAAGLAEYASIAVGDARETLREAPEPIDLVLIDGWPVENGKSLALEVLEVLEPKLRRGAIVVNDNEEEDYLAYVRDPRNGYRSLSIPWKGSTELSFRA